MKRLTDCFFLLCLLFVWCYLGFTLCFIVVQVYPVVVFQCLIFSVSGLLYIMVSRRTGVVSFVLWYLYHIFDS